MYGQVHPTIQFVLFPLHATTVASKCNIYKQAMRRKNVESKTKDGHHHHQYTRVTLAVQYTRFQIRIADWHEPKCTVTLRIRNLFVLLHFIHIENNWLVFDRMEDWSGQRVYGKTSKQLTSQIKWVRYVQTYGLVMD